MPPNDEAIAALLRVVDEAELRPYESDDDRSFAACGHFAGHAPSALVGGFYLVVADSIIAQVVPTPGQAWLAFAAFDHLTATPPAASNPDTKRALRRRMQVLELLVRLSITDAYDWQTHLVTHDRRSHHHHIRHALEPARPMPPPPCEAFRWSDVLRQLVGSTWIEPTTQLALMALRWGHPRFLIEWQHDPIPDDFPVMLDQLLSGVDAERVPSWERDARLSEIVQKDLNRTNTPHGLQPVMRHRIVELGLAFHHGRVTTSLLFGIIEVLERFGDAQCKRRDQAIARGDPVVIEFRVTSLRFEHMCTVAGSAIVHLGDLVRTSDNLFIDEIKLPRLVREEDRCVQRCIADLITPVQVTERRDSPSSGGTRAPRPLRRLVCQNDSRSFALFGSAMRYDTIIQELDVYYIANDMDAVAAWLAFGFFHADSNCQVQSLCLRMPGSVDFDNFTPPNAICSVEWIQIFKRVLCCAASPEDLAPIDPKTIKSGKRKRASATTETESPLVDVPLPEGLRLYVEVTKQTKARSQPHLRSPVVAVIGADPDRDDEDEDDTADLVRPVTRFQVVRKLHGWIAIAVPGAGAAWIQSDVVTAEHTEPSHARSSGNPSVNRQVKSFAWVGGSLSEDYHLRRQHGDTLMQLLALIGEPLEVLQLPSNGLMNDHVAEILRCCPNLKELNLAHNDITDIGPLVDAYADGSCKITTLNVSQDGEEHARVVQQTSRIVELGNDDPSKCTVVRRLALRVTPFDEDRLDYYINDVIPPMQRALFKSPKLEFARVHCDDLDQGNLANEITRLRHQECDGAICNGVANDELFVHRPLSLRAKLALLSVVRHESKRESALGGFDAGVVGLIMQFAPTTQMRIVSIAADPPMF